jgi:PKD repeat protein
MGQSFLWSTFINMLNIKTNLLIIGLLFSLNHWGQPFHTLNLDYRSCQLNFKTEPAVFLFDSSFLYSYWNDRIYFNNKATADLMGFIGGKYPKKNGSAFDSLFTLGSGIAKLFPDSLLAHQKNLNIIGNRIKFVIPDTDTKDTYHYFYCPDSLVSKTNSVAFDLVFYRIDFELKPTGINVLTSPILIGTIQHGEYYSADFITRKNCLIRIRNDMKGFYAYTIARDSQEVFYCDLKTLVKKQTSHFLLSPDTDCVIDEFIYTAGLDPAYFSTRPHIFLTIMSPSRDTIAYHNYANNLLYINQKTGLIEKYILLDTLRTDYSGVKYDTIYLSNSFAFSSDGLYVYRAVKNYLTYPVTYLVLNKFDLTDLSGNWAKKYQLFNDTVPESNSSVSSGNHDYNLFQGPCGRIFLYIRHRQVLVVNKPDCPYPYEKFYANFPAIAIPDTNQVSVTYLQISFGAMTWPLKFYYKLNTKEEYHCNSVTLHIDADTLYKTFKWYVWNKSTQQLDSSVGSSCTISPLDSGMYYKVRGTTADGFSAWYSDSLYPQLPPKARFGVLQEQHCQYITMNFFDSSTYTKYSPHIANSWHWYFGDGTDTLITDTNNQQPSLTKGNIKHIYQQNGSYTVKLAFYNGLCTDTFTLPQQIYITPAPKPGIMHREKDRCLPVELFIEDTVSNCLKKIYTWGDGKDTTINCVGNCILNLSHTYTNIGIYKIKQTLYGSTGCITKDSINISPAARPKYELGNDTIICKGETMTLYGLNGNYIHLWSNGDTSSNTRITQSGKYKVTISKGECIIKDSLEVIEGDENICGISYRIFPNPFSETFRIDGYSRKERMLNCEIFAMNGSIVKKTATPNEVQQGFSFTVNTQNMAVGVYILKLTTSLGVKYFKIVKVE